MSTGLLEPVANLDERLLRHSLTQKLKSANGQISVGMRGRPDKSRMSAPDKVCRSIRHSRKAAKPRDLTFLPATEDQPMTATGIAHQTG